MRCSCYSTAISYQIPSLFQSLQTKGKVEIHRNVIHLQIPNLENEICDIFYFPYGTTILWGFTEPEEKEQLALLKGFEKSSYNKPECDFFTFSYEKTMQIQEDRIVLPNKKSFTKLAISYGLAQSLELTNFETILQKTIAESEIIPKEIAKKGKISLSRKDISKKLGEIFLERTFINLHSEILDTPEFFWDYPEFESCYTEIIHYLEINKRVELLNRRVNILHDLFEILSNEIRHQHSSRLEWIVILLILVEVLFLFFKDIFHVI